MITGNKGAVWALVALVLATVFVVSALAMNRGNHAAALRNAAKPATGVAATPSSGEPKPSAGIGVVSRPAGSRARRTRGTQGK